MTDYTQPMLSPYSGANEQMRNALARVSPGTPLRDGIDRIVRSKAGALLVLTDAGTARGPGIPGTVTLRVFEGARHVYEVDIGAGHLIRVESPGALGDRLFRLGDRVRISTSSDTVVIVPEE